MATFMHSALKELTDQQVRFAPPARRAEQLARAQKLLGELDPAKAYPYQFICYRITEFRPESYPDLLIPGQEVLHDLGLLIEALGVVVPGVELTDDLVTLDQLASQLNVFDTNDPTLAQNLAWLDVVLCEEAKRQVVYQREVIDRFLASHEQRVERGSKFSQMSDEERESILRWARRMSRISGSHAHGSQPAHRPSAGTVGRGDSLHDSQL